MPTYSATLGAAQDALAAPALNAGFLGVQVTGTMSLTLQFEGTVDGSTWVSVPAYPSAGTASVTSATAAGVWYVSAAGLSQFRVRCSAYTSGAAVVTLNVGQGTGALAAAIPGSGTTTVSGSVTATISGTPTVSLGSSTVPVTGSTTATVAGDVAAGSSDAGNPVKFGGVARTAAATAVTNGQRVNATFDLGGKQVVAPYTVPELLIDGVATASTTATTSVIAAGGSGVRNHVTTIIAANSSTTGVNVDIKSSTTTRMTLPVPASGGVVVNLAAPLRGGDNEAIQFAMSAAVSSITVTCLGYKGT